MSPTLAQVVHTKLVVSTCSWDYSGGAVGMYYLVSSQSQVSYYQYQGSLQIDFHRVRVILCTFCKEQIQHSLTGLCRHLTAMCACFCKRVPLPCMASATWPCAACAVHPHTSELQTSVRSRAPMQVPSCCHSPRPSHLCVLHSLTPGIACAPMYWCIVTQASAVKVLPLPKSEDAAC